MTSVQRVTAALSKTKKAWFIGMTAAVVGFFFTPLPLAHAIYLIPLGIFTYFGSIILTIKLMEKSMEHQATRLEELEKDNAAFAQLQADIKAGLVKADTEEMFQRLRDCGIMEVLPVGEVSEEIVGSYNGHSIYEWVEIQDPFTKQMEKFYYHSPGYSDGDGTPIIPEDDSKVFAHVNGIVYAREA